MARLRQKYKKLKYRFDLLMRQPPKEIVRYQAPPIKICAMILLDPFFIEDEKYEEYADRKAARMLADKIFEEGLFSKRKETDKFFGTSVYYSIKVYPEPEGMR